MSEQIDKKDLESTIKDLKREHPSLQERLIAYRDRRDSYEAKRLSRPAAATPAQARQGARRTLRG